LGAKKLTEEKCSGAPMKTKGIETKGPKLDAIKAGVKNIGNRAGFGGAAAVGNAKKFIKKHEVPIGVGALGAGTVAAGAGMAGVLGAAGAGSGKRKEGFKEGVRAGGRSVIHPLDSSDPAEAAKYNPYVAGKKLREKA
jgi:hypothetical protein